MNSKVENIDKEQSLLLESDYEQIIEEEDEEKEEMELITLTNCFNKNLPRIRQQFPNAFLYFQNLWELEHSLSKLGFVQFIDKLPTNTALNLIYCYTIDINSVQNVGVCTIVMNSKQVRIVTSNFNLKVDFSFKLSILMIFMAVILILKEKCADSFAIGLLDFIKFHCN